MSSDIHVSPSPLAGEGWGEGAQASTNEVGNIAIRVQNLSKCYQIYDAPRDRLKQFVVPRLQRLAGQAPKQYFREFWALKDVSFQVKKGETVGIIGRNGSGKANYCLRALIEKGLVKLGNFSKNQNKRQYAYLLTPAGLEEKARIAQAYLKRKEAEFEAIRREIEALKSELAPPKTGENNGV